MKIAIRLFLPWACLIIAACAGFRVTAPALDYREGEFITRWAVTDPIVAGDNYSELEQTFNRDELTTSDIWASVASGALVVAGQSYRWRKLQSDTPVVELPANAKLGVYSYAIAQVFSQQERETFLSVGSDDAIKIWINGELVHNHWIFRPVAEDQEFIPVTLAEGSNTITVKLLNAQGSCGLSMRFLNAQAIEQKFADSASSLSLEVIDALVGSGINIDAKNEYGLTALQLATLDGLKARPQQLVARGAKPEQHIQDLAKLTREYIESGIDSKYAGMAYLLSKNGEVIYKGATGKANLATGQLIDTKTKFKIASLTKQFTAAAVLKLQEQGLLSLQDPLSKYFPDFPKGKDISIRQLLNNTSGVHEIINTPNFDVHSRKAISKQALLEKIQRIPLDFEPGERWSYSNSGYFLLGLIIEKVAKKSLAQYWQETFFLPLNMNNTGSYVDGVAYDNEALGYSFVDSKWKRSRDWHITHFLAAGNMYSTVEDLFLWNEALYGGKVLSPESLQDATTPAKLNNGTEVFIGYGLGLLARELPGRKMVMHEGALPGFRTYLYRNVDSNINVISLSNSFLVESWSTGFDFKEYIVSKMASIARYQPGLNISKRKSGFNTSLSDYVGNYKYSDKIKKITLEDGKLFSQITGHVKLEMHRHAEDLFYYNQTAAEMQFQRDEHGDVVSLIHNQHGYQYKIQKVKPVTYIKVPIEELQRLTGVYTLDANYNATIKIIDGQLYGQGTGEWPFRLRPISALEFRTDAFTTRYVFKQNSEGQINKLNLIYLNGVVNTLTKEIPDNN